MTQPCGWVVSCQGVVCMCCLAVVWLCGWLCRVVVSCGCVMWLCRVAVSCGCVVWLCGVAVWCVSRVAVWCGCVVWLVV